MRAVVQRVTEASVSIDQRVVGAIARGVLVYLGVAPGDTVSDRQYIAGKIRDLRIFDDDAGRMNVSLGAGPDLPARRRPTSPEPSTTR
jgi:D-tyrosyl-tRNA(Tyr) deacylase